MILEQVILENPKLISLLPTAAFTSDRHGKVLFFNAEAARLWGYTPDLTSPIPDKYCLAQHLYRLDGSPLPHSEGPMSQTLKTGLAVRDFEFIIERPDTSRIAIQVNTMPIHNSEGELLGAIATFQDVSERRNAREVLERASDAFFAVDYRWMVTNVNEATLKIMKKNRKELVDASLWDVFPDGALDEASGDTPLIDPFRSQCQMAMKSQSRLRFEKFHLLLGIWAEVTVYPSFDGLSIYFRDITERKRAEDLLKESESRFRRIAIKKALLAEAGEQLSSSLEYRKNMADLLGLLVPRLRESGFVLLLNEDGQVLLSECRTADASMKEALQKLVGESHAKQGSLLRDAIRLRRTTIQNHLNKNEFSWTERRDFVPCASLITPLIMENRVIGVIGLLSLQAERVFEEEDAELLESIAVRASVSIHNAILYEGAQKAITARDDLMSICSHEIRTPITSMRLQAGLIKRALESGKEIFAPSSQSQIFKFVNHMEQQIERLVRLVNDMLDFSRIQSGHFKIQAGRVSISELLAEVVERLLPRFHDAGCKVAINAEAGIFVSGDSFRLEQVIVNLLTNAIRYGYGKPVEVSLSLNSGRVELFVQDQGRGISPVDHQRIFLKFERAISDMNISGLGLGLFIAREIVEAHDGTIRVESALGEGAKFIVSLPALQAVRHPQALPPVLQPPHV